jgi:hypothetical protein
MAVVQDIGLASSAAAAAVVAVAAGGDVDFAAPIWVSTALTAAQIARMSADVPMFVHTNVTGTVGAEGEPQWRNGGTWTTGTDETVSDAILTWSTPRLYDGRGTTPTAGASDDPQHLICSLDEVAFDTIAIVGHNFLAATVSEVRVEIADDDAFSLRLQVITQWTTGFGARLVSTALGAGLETGNADGARYSSVPYLRVVIEGASSVVQIGELFLGTRWAPPQPQDDAADERMTASLVDVAETQGGRVQRVPRWTGRLQTALTWHPDTAEDVAGWRALYTGSQWGRDPVLWIPAPSSAPEAAYLVRLETDLAVANDAAEGYSTTVGMTELAPYVSKES